ncbi:MAG: hypothetical protein OXC11_11810 [Rhodospirillales bacterium]|nr:hypothetical protein [Rhodospirillales bacterium]
MLVLASLAAADSRAGRDDGACKTAIRHYEAVEVDAWRDYEAALRDIRRRYQEDLKANSTWADTALKNGKTNAWGDYKAAVNGGWVAMPVHCEAVFVAARRAARSERDAALESVKTLEAELKTLKMQNAEKAKRDYEAAEREAKRDYEAAIRDARRDRDAALKNARRRFWGNALKDAERTAWRDYEAAERAAWRDYKAARR